MAIFFKKPFRIPESVRLERAMIAKIMAEWLLFQQLQMKNGIGEPDGLALHLQVTVSTSADRIQAIADDYSLMAALGLYSFEQNKIAQTPKALGRNVRKFIERAEF